MAGSGGGGDAVASSSSIKWQVALAIGVPVAVGVGYWYYRSYKSPGNGDGYDRCSKSSKSGDLQEVSTKPSKPVVEKKPLPKALNLKEEGNKHFKTGNYEEALKCYQAAIDIGSDVNNVDLATFYQNRAAANEQLKNYEGVKQDCSMALTLNPKYTKALLRRAKAYEALKNLPEALEDITEACILEEFQVQSTLKTADRILKDLGRLHAREAIMKKKPIMPSKYFIKTYFSTFSNDPLAPYLEDNSADCSLGFRKAIDCLRRGDYESIIGACIEEVNQTEAEAGFKNEALVLRATMYILIGRYASALEDLESVIGNMDATLRLRVNALIKRASIHMQLEDANRCLEDFKIAVDIDPDNADIYHQRGQVNLLMDRLEEAQNDFNTAVTLNPSNPITTVQKCYTDYRVALEQTDGGKLAEVLQRFEEYTREFPSCPECFTLYAQVLSDQQLCEKADQLYVKSIKLDPENAALLVHRAILTLQWTGEIEIAVKMISEALVLDEKCGFACETLGTIQVQRGNLEEAINMFDKAIEFAKTELELAHLYSLRDATIAQLSVFRKRNLRVPTIGNEIIENTNS